MPQIVHGDAVFRVDPNTPRDYDSDNALVNLLGIVEKVRLAAERECYDPNAVQHLLPHTWLELWGPSPPDTDNLDPATQDNKTDFHKQNVRRFHLADTQAARGWAAAGDWRGPFLSLTYRGGPDSALSEAAGGQLGDAIGCVVSILGRPQATLRAPYDPETDRYVVEIWGRDQGGLRDALGERGQAAVDGGSLIGRPDLVSGAAGDFAREAVDGKDLRGVSTQHTLHPILPLYLDVTWTADPGGGGAQDGPHRLGFEMLVRGWDHYLSVGYSSNPHGGVGELERMAVDGRDMRGVANGHTMHPILPLYLDVTWTAQPDGSGATDGPHRLGFEMLIRGWDNYLSVGSSGNPHGGVGTLEYRTLLSNYGAYQGSGELARVLEPYNFDAFGNKGHKSGDREAFMAVDYMDLHVLEPACGIGLHRHRDNQEIFFMLDGEGIMVIGDWADSGRRARSFEVRRLMPGHFAMLKGGNLHGLMNPADVPNSLFMFGGYD